MSDKEIIEMLKDSLKEKASTILELRSEIRALKKQIDDNERRYNLLVASTDGICSLTPKQQRGKR